MSDVVSGSSGTDQKPSGSDGDVAINDSSQDSVKYETYKKVLAEKKKRDEELKLVADENAILKREKKEREENELKAKEDYKKLLELRDKELNETKEKYNGLNSSIQESVKFNSFLESLPGQLDKKYWRMVDTSEIVIDPNTNEPDPSSIKRVAEKFQAEFGELIQTPGKAKLPNNASTGPIAAINDETWSKMSPADKKKNLSQYHAYNMAKIGKT